LSTTINRRLRFRVEGGTASAVIDLAEPAAERERVPPVILAVRVGGLLTFWCPFCKRQHWHGPANGHRQAPLHQPGIAVPGDRLRADRDQRQPRRPSLDSQQAGQPDPCPASPPASHEQPPQH
jgi:hypothetical protein